MPAILRQISQKVDFEIPHLWLTFSSAALHQEIYRGPAVHHQDRDRGPAVHHQDRDPGENKHICPLYLPAAHTVQGLIWPNAGRVHTWSGDCEGGKLSSALSVNLWLLCDCWHPSPTHDRLPTRGSKVVRNPRLLVNLHWEKFVIKWREVSGGVQTAGQSDDKTAWGEGV